MHEAHDRIVVLLRHGIAEDPQPGRSDEARALTPEGQKRMKEVGKGLCDLLPKVGAVISSPLVRAVQTSLFVAKACDLKQNVTTDDRLKPQSSPESIRALIESTEDRVVVLVGHEPTLTAAMKALTGLNGPLELKKGGCYGLREHEDGFALEWVLTPRVLRRVHD